MTQAASGGALGVSTFAKAAAWRRSFRIVDVGRDHAPVAIRVDRALTAECRAQA